MTELVSQGWYVWPDKKTNPQEYLNVSESTMVHFGHFALIPSPEA